MKIKAILGTLLISAFFCQAPQALIWDFGTLAENEGEGDFSAIFPSGIEIPSTDGVVLTASAGDDIAYLDGYDAGRPAGLGVCKSLDEFGFCDPSDDDNMGYGEQLTITFSERMNLEGLYLRDGDHFISPDNTEIQISVDGGSTWGSYYTVDPEGYVDLSSANLDGYVFDFRAGVWNTENPSQRDILYINKLVAVPEPASLMILGLGLLGMGLVNRRRK